MYSLLEQLIKKSVQKIIYSNQNNITNPFSFLTSNRVSTVSLIESM